jgi:DNA topoisomerase-1
MTEELKLEGYCFKCREKRMMEEPQAEWAANGTPGTRGRCPVCGGTIYKTGHTAAHDHLPKPEIVSGSKGGE